mmetsp:Transcript_35269/g.82482  ORF Transcript_35269/g.82482 Transcript_35269/m.82482 type:complete len:223 (-) Transcript_35269:282-950(-)
MPKNFMHHQFSATWSPPRSGATHKRAYDPEDASSWLINTAFMGFEANHPFLAHLLGRVYQTYVPDEWTSVGNDLVWDEVQKLRAATRGGDALAAAQLNFTVMRMASAAPIPYVQMQRCSARDDEMCAASCYLNLEAGYAFHTYATWNRERWEAAFRRRIPAGATGRAQADHNVSAGDGPIGAAVVGRDSTDSRLVFESGSCLHRLSNSFQLLPAQCDRGAAA